MTRKTYTEPARDIPVLMETDIVVVGGGTTGPFAAIAAARQGKRVVMIERFGSLGGNLTLGLNTKPSGALVGGLPLEIWNMARGIGGAGADYMALTKTGGGRDANGLRADTSMHLWFDQDLVAYKFTIRIGGQPWWSAATPSRDGTFTQSPFVVLEAR